MSCQDMSSALLSLPDQVNLVLEVVEAILVKLATGVPTGDTDHHAWQQRLDKLSSPDALDRYFVLHYYHSQLDPDDCIIRLLTLSLVTLDYLLRNASSSNQSEPLLSTKQESSVRLAIAYTLRLGFYETLRGTFANAEPLFPARYRLSLSNKGHKELRTCEPLYLLLTDLLIDPKSGLGAALREVAHSCLLAMFVIVGRARKPVKNTSVTSEAKRLVTSEATTRYDALVEDNLDKVMQWQCSDLGRPLVLRDLLLFNCYCPPSQSALQATIIALIRSNLGKQGGLETLLNATLDSETSSERETTVHQRLQATANVVHALPCTRSQKPVYLRGILEQLTAMLTKQDATSSASRHPLDIYWRTAALILSNINSTNPELTRQYFFAPLEQCFKSDPENAITTVHRLVLARRCLPELFPLFTPLFYIRFHLQSSVMALGKVLDETLTELIKEVPRSVYLLDNAVCVQSSNWIDRYKLEIDSTGQEICYRVVYISELNQSENVDRVNQLATFTLNFMDRIAVSFRFDIFFLLLDRLISPHPPPIAFLLIGPLGERLFSRTISKQEEESRENLLFSSKRTVRFLSSTFERIVSRLVDPCQLEDQENLVLWRETFAICLQILGILLDRLEDNPNLVANENDDDDNEDIDLKNVLEELKPCQNSLRIVLDSTVEVLDQAGRELAEHLYHQFECLYHPIELKKTDGCKVKTQLEEAMKDLRHSLMPVRAHALITLKQLVYARGESVQECFDEVLVAVRQCLLDSDSYIYLAAIKTLHAMAHRDTDKVLPILLDHLIELGDPPRPLAYRLKVGEVLLQLTHSVGDFAHHYSSLFIGRLLTGIQQSSEAAIRISCLSCLGDFCTVFPYGLSKYMVELSTMATQLLTTEPELEVRRATLLFLTSLLRGVDGKTAPLLDSHLLEVLRLIRRTRDTTLDETLQRHANNAELEVTRIAKQLLATSDLSCQ